MQAARSTIKRKRPAYPSSALLAERTEWAKQFPVCWCCGNFGGPFGVQTHEMASKAQAPDKWAFKANYFRACQECHAKLGGENLDYQLALKGLYDPEDFNLDEVKAARGRDPESVTFKDLFWQVVGMLKGAA